MPKSRKVKKSHINFFVPVTLKSVQKLFEIVQKKLRNGAETITILISSPRGQVNAGITAYNFLMGIPVEAGFEYVTDQDDLKFFRKRK